MEEFENKIICGNNVDVLKKFPDECIDFVLTSPPYDSARSYHGYTFDFPGIAEQLTRVLKPGGVIVWVVGDMIIDGSESLSSFKQAIHFVEVNKLLLHDTMIWHKPYIKFPETVRYHQGFEYMFVFSKGKPKTFNPLKDRKNIYSTQKVHGKNRVGDDKWVQNANTGKQLEEFGMRTNVWTFHHESGTKFFKNTGKVGHPAVFPFALAQDHVLSWSNAGDWILDPFCGSGSTCRMAKANGRRYTGIDISEEYCKLSESMCHNVGFV